MKKPNGYWQIKENVIEESKKYTTIKEFSVKCGSAYSVARQNGWINEFVWLKRQIKENGYWGIKENVIEVSKRYSNRTEFAKKCSGGYQSAIKNGWLKEMPWLNVDINKYEKGYSVYVYIDDIDKYVYVGLTCNKEYREFQHKNPNSPVYDYFTNKNKEIPKPIYIMNGVSAIQAQYWENWMVTEFRAQGFNILNSARTGIGSGALGGCIRKWTKNRVFLESRKYTSKKEFERNCETAYKLSIKNKWIEEMTWLIPKQKKSGFWNNLSNLIEECKKYKTKSDLRKFNQSAYRGALRNNLLDKLFNN